MLAKILVLDIKDFSRDYFMSLSAHNKYNPCLLVNFPAKCVGHISRVCVQYSTVGMYIWRATFQRLRSCNNKMLVNTFFAITVVATA